MKVNIKKLPKGYSVVNGRIMNTKAEGGTSTGDQHNYGLVTTPPIPSSSYFSSGGDSFIPENNVARSIHSVPRDEANLEAEKGETVLTDFNNDGNFELYDINGNRHHKGGTPLNLPPQSFIYSDTSKMKLNKYELAELGITSKKKITPAKVSKNYQLNNFIGILDDAHSDNITIDTAEYMLNKNKKSLSQLAFLQEAKKQFEDGVPLASYPYLTEKGINPLQFSQQVEQISAQEAEQKMMMQLPYEQRLEIMLMKEAQKKQAAMQEQQMMAQQQGMQGQQGGPMHQMPDGSMMPGASHGQPPQGMMPPQAPVQQPMAMARRGGQMSSLYKAQMGGGAKDFMFNYNNNGVTPTPKSLTVSDIGHGALDVAGMIPGFGEPFDAVNAAWYGAEGDVTNAALSMAGMLPFVGWAATASKYGTSAIKKLPTELQRQVSRKADWLNKNAMDWDFWDDVRKNPGNYNKTTNKELKQLGEEAIKKRDVRFIVDDTPINKMVNQIEFSAETGLGPARELPWNKVDYQTGGDFLPKAQMGKDFMFDIQPSVQDNIQKSDFNFNNKGNFNFTPSYLAGNASGSIPFIPALNNSPETEYINTIQKLNNELQAANDNNLDSYISSMQGNPSAMNRGLNIDNIKMWEDHIRKGGTPPNTITPEYTIAYQNVYPDKTLPPTYDNTDNTPNNIFNNTYVTNPESTQNTTEPFENYRYNSSNDNDNITSYYDRDTDNLNREDGLPLDYSNVDSPYYVGSQWAARYGGDLPQFQDVGETNEVSTKGNSHWNQLMAEREFQIKEREKRTGKKNTVSDHESTLYGEQWNNPMNANEAKELYNWQMSLAQGDSIPPGGVKEIMVGDDMWGKVKMNNLPWTTGVNRDYEDYKNDNLSWGDWLMDFIPGVDKGTRSHGDGWYQRGGDLPIAKKGIEYKGYTYSKRELKRLANSKDPNKVALYNQIMNPKANVSKEDLDRDVNAKRVDTEDVTTNRSSGTGSWTDNYMSDSEESTQLRTDRYEAYKKVQKQKGITPLEEDAFHSMYTRFQNQNRWMNDNYSQDELSGEEWDSSYEYVDGKKTTNKKGKNWKYNEMIASNEDFTPLTQEEIQHMQAGFIGGKSLNVLGDDRAELQNTGVADEKLFEGTVSETDGLWGNTTNRELETSEEVTAGVECENAEAMEAQCADKGGVWVPYNSTDQTGCVCNQPEKQGDIPPQQQQPDPEFWLQDEMAITNAMDNKFSLNKKYPWTPKFDLMQIDPVFKDPTREIAAIGEQATMAANTASAFSGPQRAAAVQAKAQGVAGRQIADAMNKVQSDNVTIANTVGQKNTELQYKTQLLNKNAAKQLFDNTVLTDQNYDNALRQANTEVTKQMQNAYTNRANTANLNTLYDNFNITPETGGLVNITNPDQYHADANYVDPKTYLENYVNEIDALDDAGVPKDQWPTYVIPNQKKKQTNAQNNSDAITSGWNNGQGRHGIEVRRKNLLRKGAELRNWFSPLKGY